MDSETMTLVLARHLNMKKSMPKWASHSKERRIWRKVLCPDLIALLKEAKILKETIVPDVET
jgi:hypothetical protein